MCLDFNIGVRLSNVVVFLSSAAVDHPHSLSCKLELGSDQEIPKDWYPFVTIECEIMGAVVSQTRVKSLGTVNDIQPQKHLTSWTRYHCQVRQLISAPTVWDSTKSNYLLYLFFFLLAGSWEEMDWNWVWETVWLYDTVMDKEDDGFICIYFKLSKGDGWLPASIWY